MKLYENHLQLCFATASRTNVDGDNMHKDEDVDTFCKTEELEEVQRVKKI